MDDLKKQLKTNLESDIYEFNNNTEYADIRLLYINNFDKIVSYIERSPNYKLAVEDIAALASSNILRNKIIEQILLLKEINKAIAQQKLTLSNIKNH